MTIWNWLPSLLTSGALLVLGRLLWPALKITIEKSLTSAFDERLERVRSDLRKQEEQNKADLRAQSLAIEELRRGPLATLNTRQAALDKRRLEAVERIWIGATKWSQFKATANMARVMKFDALFAAAKDESRDSEKIRSFARSLTENATLINMHKDTQDVQHERPFVSADVWAHYLTYTMTLSRPVLKLTLLQYGLGEELMASEKPFLEMVKKLLPDRAEYIEKLGEAGVYSLVDELEERLLSALQLCLEGKDIDEKGLERANDIIRQAEQLAATASAPS